jgi:hypothetical protein
MLLYSRHYAIEGRSYALLLAAGAASLLFWTIASDTGRDSRRRGALICLWITLALAITSHFYGLLLLVPVCVAEASRSVFNRRLDPLMLATLALAAASVLLNVPFMGAALAFKPHYYPQIPTSGTIVFCFRWLLALPQGRPTIAGSTLIVLAGLLLLVFSFRKARRSERPAAVTLWVGLAAMALLPVFAFFLATFVTHAFEPRYELPATAGLAALLALCLAGPLHSRRVYAGLLAVLVFAAALLSWRETKRFRREGAVEAAQLRLPPSVTNPNGVPAEQIFVHDPSTFLLIHFYRPPEVARHFTLVSSEALEYRWLGTDAGSRFGDAMAKTLGPRPGFHFISYEQFRLRPGPQVVVIVPSNLRDEWLQFQMPADGFTLTPVGPALGGTVYRSVRRPGVAAAR